MILWLLAVALASPPAPGTTVVPPTSALCPTACAAGEFYSLDDETCVDDEGAEAGADPLVVSTATGAVVTVSTCTQAAITTAISDVADVVRGTSKVGVVALPACTVDLTGALWLESGVVLWGEGATTLRADPSLDATGDPACAVSGCAHFATDCDGWQCMIAGEDVHRVGVIGVTLDGRQADTYCATFAEAGATADCRRTGIRIWGTSSDVLVHDVAAIYLNQGYGLGHGGATATGLDGEAFPTDRTERLTLSCSSAMHAGRVDTPGWSGDCPPALYALQYGGGVAAYDSAADFRIESLNTRCVGGNGINIHGHDGAILGGASVYDARNKATGAARIVFRGNAFDRAQGYATSTHAVALSLQPLTFSHDGTAYTRLTKGVTVGGNRFRRKNSVDRAIEVLAGASALAVESNLYEGPTGAKGTRAILQLYNTDLGAYSGNRLECLRYTPPSAARVGVCEVDYATLRVLPHPDSEPSWVVVQP